MTLLDLERELAKATAMFRFKQSNKSLSEDDIAEGLEVVQECCKQLQVAAVAMVSPELTRQIAEMEEKAEVYNAEWKKWRRDRDKIIAEAVKAENEACATLAEMVPAGASISTNIRNRSRK